MLQQDILSLLEKPSLETLKRLFCEVLLWESDEGAPQTRYKCVPIAQMGGARVFYCEWQSPNLPTLSERREVYKALEPIAYKHLVCYTTADKRQVSIVWANQSPTKNIELRALPYEVGIPARTTVEQIAQLHFPIKTEADLDTVLQRLRSAFDVEAVTERFFQQFREHYDAIEKSLRSAIDTESERALFALRVMNRLLFIRFLERKGWLAFRGRRDYLRALWEDHQQNPTGSFYTSRLKPLFFSALNNPQRRNLIAINQGGLLTELLGDVPYLKGGLFEKSKYDQLNIDLPDSLIGPLLTNLLYRFNFTITESTPFDIEVAVDPEMLGKVFEELVTGRHEQGAYYTPRPVVAFMCQRALIGYLQSRCPHETPDALAKFVKARDSSGLKDPEAVLHALKQVRVCDPACGSGAYLLGMLQELLELRTALFEQKQLAPETLYQRKLEIIQNNLYGVDIDPFAVDIARLRLWLSLVVDDERNPLTHDADVSLPNLDFKIEQGDSLLAPDPQGGTQPDMFREADIRQYEQLKSEYLRTHSEEQKRILRNEIDRMRQQIRQWTHKGQQVEGFDWRVEFAEVFMDGGFDIIVANPPYVRQELIPKSSKPTLLKLYPECSKGRSDLYVYFYARALQLLKTGGMHVFVCSNSWLDVGFGGELQVYLLKNAHILEIYDSAVERQFASADVNTIISIMRKGCPPDGAETLFIRLNAEFSVAVEDPAHQRVVRKTRAELWQAGLDENGNYVGDKWGGKYLRAPEIFFTILEKGKGKLVRLGDIAEVRRGFTTGANEFFYLEALTPGPSPDASGEGSTFAL